MTTLKLTSNAVSESMLIRCNLSEASSPVEVDYLVGEGWTHTQYQAANIRHRLNGLAEIGRELLADAIQCDAGELGKLTVEEV
jgi:hypothetical protein